MSHQYQKKETDLSFTVMLPYEDLQLQFEWFSKSIAFCLLTEGLTEGLTEELTDWLVNQLIDWDMVVFIVLYARNSFVLL